MKKLILIALLCFPLLSMTTDTQVYICTGKYAKSYHATTSCRGMKACKGEIKKVSLSEAQKAGRKPCGYCYH